MLEKLGYKNVSPAYNDERTDIIQTLELGSKENLVSFTQGIQSTSPIDSFVRVIAAPMPGYPFDEVMAAGSFTQGSTIELSADAPVVEKQKRCLVHLFCFKRLSNCCIILCNDKRIVANRFKRYFNQ